MTPDIEAAREHLESIRALLADAEASPAGRADILSVRALCQSIAELVDDNCCREELDFLELYAGELFSARHDTGQPGPQVRRDTVKRKARKCLVTVDARLVMLENEQLT